MVLQRSGPAGGPGSGPPGGSPADSPGDSSGGSPGGGPVICPLVVPMETRRGGFGRVGGYVLGPVGVFLKYAGHKGSCAGEKIAFGFIGLRVASIGRTSACSYGSWVCSDGSSVFLWLPGWGFPASRLPSIPVIPQMFL